MSEDKYVDKFEIEKRISASSLSIIYRARDTSTGSRIALKLLHGDDAAEHKGRFEREARLLEQLRHPGIVRHIAHGESVEGKSYLAMEWVEGETLSRRLSQTGLTMAEAVRLAARVAELLAVVHAQGIVHRDIKPGNILLRDGDLEKVVLIDFGIARPGPGSTAITHTGVMLGTLGYMAPEQARGTKQLDARADIFALGAVLFKCITGAGPFAGDDAIAILAKLLFEDAPRASSIRKDVPAPLDELVARMLSRDPAGRPAGAGVVAAELHAIAPHASEARAVKDEGERGTDVLTRGEQRLVCVIAAAAASAHGEEETTFADGTWQGMKSLSSRLKAAIGPFGAHLEALPSGVIVVTMTGRHSATDQAARAARCALAMRRAVPNLPMVLATGRAVLDERVPTGEAVDRAVRMLRGYTAGDIDAQAAGKPGAIHVDEVTAGLLDARFAVRAEGGFLELVQEKSAVDAGRSLLGKTTPCVGRERELVTLEGVFAECVADDVARAVLVTAPAGVGKTRLRYELLRTLASRGVPQEAWVARGDPMRAGSPFGLLSQIVRLAAGVLDGEPPRLQREKIRARVTRCVRANDVTRVTQFLAEMIGVTTPGDTEDVQLRAARNDAVLMGDQMRRAFEEWLGAECAQKPVLLVLEDLQWGDLPSVKFVDSALRVLHDRPFMVLALARPEVKDLFADLWAGRNLQQLKLPELSKKACEKLVKQVLGETTSEEVVARVVARSGGNAFYLEELIRSVAEGHGDAPPETVLSMVQSRLESLEPEGRRALRAASVYGQTFWKGGVVALLAGEEELAQSWLDELTDRELITRRDTTRFRGEEEYIFRNALVGDAAYGMLKDRDRVLGHRLAANWLERVGESEAASLAEHWERGEEPKRAVVLWRRAAAQALEGNDFAAALARAERGIACGAEGDGLGRLKLRLAEAHKWRGENAEAESCAREAMTLLSHGSRRWMLAVGEAVEASGKLGHTAELHKTVDDLCELSTDGTVDPAHVIALTRAAVMLLQAGNAPSADDLLALADRASKAMEDDPLATGHLERTRSYRALVAGNPAESHELYMSAIASLERAGDVRAACRYRVSAGSVSVELGAYDTATTVLREALASAEKMGLSGVAAGAWHCLGMALARSGHLDDAIAQESAAVDAFVEQRDRRMEAASRLYCARIRLMAGDGADAEQHARKALEVGSFVPAIRAYASAALAAALTAQNKTTDARAAAEEAMTVLDSLGTLEEGESFVRLVHAECLHNAGDVAMAQDAIDAARARLLLRAEKIKDECWRASFLENVEENARTLALAKEWTA